MSRIITDPNAPKVKQTEFVGADSLMYVKDGVLHYYKEQDVEPILERNARKRAEGSGWGGDWHEVAEVPETVFIEWLKELNITFQQWARDPEAKAKVWAKLRDREYNKFRTKEGRI